MRNWIFKFLWYNRKLVVSLRVDGTFINSSMPVGSDVLHNLLRYSMISLVSRPTDTAAYRE